MNPVEILGLVAGCLTTAAFVPQAWRTVRTGSARDFSAAMLVLFVAGIGLWLAYGLLAGIAVVTAANVATLALTLPILWVKIREHLRSRAGTSP
ncbi:SemiSWEET family sugar transporter [Roseomonas sp. HF4]|uniref:SemiSWEET family sugar transporter n=1 Tax=Roseomonas sp. HF4 TaxID=2562313 RepID=UPI0010BF7436|nr:SemiSWEET transporter [Roseomonas sp. HF4]